MAQQIQFRRDTAAQWTSANPVLGQGEPGLETDTKKVKVGDGATAWSSLAYFAGQLAADSAFTGVFVQRANNLSDVASATTARSNLGASQEVVRTAVKTSSYTASPGDLVPVDTTSGNVLITLPTAPGDKSRVVVKHVVRGGTNTVTVACGGSDVFNVASGATTLTLTLLAQAVTVAYNAAGAIWTVISDDLALSQLNSTFAPFLADLGNILVIGDSIANGVGATSSATAFPARIQAWLSGLGYKSNVIASGANGQNTSDLYTRLAAALTSATPKKVVIQASINDCSTGAGMTTQQSVDNVRGMVNSVQVYFGAEPIVVGSAPMSPAWYGSSSYTIAATQKAVDTNVAVAALCLELGVTYVDIYHEMFGKVGVLYDGLHPNDTGHDIWGRMVAHSIVGRPYKTSQLTYFTDGFGRSDSSSTLGGSFWTANSGTWGITSGSAYCVTQTDDKLATMSCGFPDHRVTGTPPAGGSGGQLAVTARGSSASAYYLAILDANANTLTLFRNNGGYTQLATISSAGVTATSAVTVVCEGARQRVYGGDKLMLEANDSVLGFGNRVGMRQSGTTACRWDYFAVTA